MGSGFVGGAEGTRTSSRLRSRTLRLLVFAGAGAAGSVEADPLEFRVWVWGVKSEYTAKVWFGRKGETAAGVHVQP